jgi:hypothetical protein
VGKGLCETAGTVAGQAVGALGNGILDTVATWVIGAATQVTKFVAQEMQQSTTPQLRSAWYEAQFQPMADLGAALGLLVALVALASAAVRRDPQALAASIAGILRAGIGTGLVVALTVIGLEIADQVSGAVLAGSPQAFWASVADAWGTSGFGGFAASGLATLIAAIELFAAVFVWLELIVRNAAIYIAVLFFPATLAAAIWPALSAWPGRLGRLLLLFVILKPVALIVLSLAGNAAAAGLSFGSGVSGSVGTILTATVIFGLAAFAPWALMFIIAADTETAYLGAGMRTAAGSAVSDSNGPSVRSAGGLRDSGGSSGAGGFSSSPGGGGSPGGGSPGGSPSPSSGGTPSPAPTTASDSTSPGNSSAASDPAPASPTASDHHASPSASSSTAATASPPFISPSDSPPPSDGAGQDETAQAAVVVGTGSVGAAAGMAATARAGGTTAPRREESATATVTDPSEGRPSDPPAPPAELTPHSPGGAAHLRLVREESPGKATSGDEDPSGPGAA